MSADGIGWVFRHSPFTGSTFLVHLAMGDSVNDQHDNQFFMSVGNLTKKTRLSRKTVQVALRALEARGCLTRISEGKGEVYCYQFEFPPQPVVFETRGRNENAPLRNPRLGSGTRGRNDNAQTQVRTQGDGRRSAKKDETETTAAAARAKYERNAKPCSECGGPGILETDKGCVPCPTCNAEVA